jgi:hypothetical protein
MEVLISYKSKHIKGFRGQQILVHRDFEKALDRLESYAAEQGITLIVNQSYRKQDQKVRGNIVAPASRSNHFVGYAIDANIRYRNQKYFAAILMQSNLDQLPEPIINFINAVRKDKSLRWGGDFKTQDPVHFDVPINHTRPKSWLTQFERCRKDVDNASYLWMFWR